MLLPRVPLRKENQPVFPGDQIHFQEQTPADALLHGWDVIRPVHTGQDQDLVAPVAHLLESLIEELGRLVPETFITLYDRERLTHLVRYVKAATVRAQRASVDYEKEQSKSYELKKFKDGLDVMLKDLSPSVSDEKRKAIEEYFWMVEEYKVSIFAQELKTAIPISPKRLEKKQKQIERMV